MRRGDIDLLIALEMRRRHRQHVPLVVLLDLTDDSDPGDVPSAGRRPIVVTW